MMKKLSVLTLAAFVASAGVAHGSALAQTVELPSQAEAEPEDADQLEASIYLKNTGVISEVREDDDSTSLVIEGPEEDSIMIFPMTDDALIFDSRTTEQVNKDELTEGQTITGYYDKDTAHIMIYPPTIAPEIVIIEDEQEGSQVKVSKFDENLVSLDNQLALTINEETILVNENGAAITEEDLSGKELIVFYTIATKSIPAQTTPQKIVALDHTDKKQEEVERLIENDNYYKNDTKMIPIRSIAQSLGFTVGWDQETRSVTVQKQNLSIQISNGDTAYSYNRSLREFPVAPEIQDGKTYVPEDIVELLIND
ncbi:copper amine oxidase N-terminal domain-containing protein [Desertibacillus haloalkaliphilus]|uniref:copper amine oxidase N-terminal domain-containing protein n=1 Tax=Desertibacillus haloalkaliphilus TaxID=1328930 RepID=UPI001C27944D|nr:copper amine oxidase N-terminal domain-containing protein [Desertibacillus haloalkaliphilus]MBU8905350.1 copper amine oxidase N-terminal domain-containing protein [Desertibacillus haloalkaliphilus]